MSITMGQLASRFALAANKVSPVTDQKLRLLSQVGVGYVKTEIQNMHAVDTGTMLNSTQAERADKNTYLIGPTVTYAPYVALGTSRMVARPFHIVAARKLAHDAKDLFTAEDLGL
jgi:predicted Ser/Thr protein kinase